MAKIRGIRHCVCHVKNQLHITGEKFIGEREQKFQCLEIDPRPCGGCDVVALRHDRGFKRNQCHAFDYPDGFVAHGR